MQMVTVWAGLVHYDLIGHFPDLRIVIQDESDLHTALRMIQNQARQLHGEGPGVGGVVHPLPSIVDQRPLLVLPGSLSPFQIEVYIEPDAMAGVRREPAQAASWRADITNDNTRPLRVRDVPRGRDLL